MARRRRIHRRVTAKSKAASIRNLEKARAARSEGAGIARSRARAQERLAEARAGFVENTPRKPARKAPAKKTVSLLKLVKQAEVSGKPIKMKFKIASKPRPLASPPKKPGHSGLPFKPSRPAGQKISAGAKPNSDYYGGIRYHPYGGGPYNINDYGGKEAPLIGKEGVDYWLAHKGQMPPIAGKKVKR